MAKSPQKFVALSKVDVEDRVIDYFADRFHRPPHEFTEKTDVKKAFNYSAKAWADLADVFNRMPWMVQLNIRLAQPQMAKIKTVGEITNLIWKSVPKLVSVTAKYNRPVEATLVGTQAAAARVRRRPRAGA